jgi:CBS domain-containing protein
MALEKQVWDIMDLQYETITPETPLAEACRVLGLFGKEKPGMPGLVVQRSSGEYLGFLTVKDCLGYLNDLYKQSKKGDREEDWLDRLRGHDPEETLITVNDALVHLEVSVSPNHKMIDLLQVLEDLGVDFIPVADGEKIVGVVRSTAILAEIAPKPRYQVY